MNVEPHDLDLNFQGQTFSCYAFAIKKWNKQRMSTADLPRLARPRRGVALGKPYRKIKQLHVSLYILVSQYKQHEKYLFTYLHFGWTNASDTGIRNGFFAGQIYELC